VTNANDDTVSVIDTASHSIDISLGDEPTGIAFA
jgi:YVTN family beta-propeller protein